MRKQKEFRVRKIKLIPGEDRVTDAAGLGALIEVFDESPLSKGFKEALPRRSSNRSLGGYRLGLIQVSSFIYGHDAIDDLEEFRGDPLFEAALKGEVAAPRTMGDFLRCFKNEHISSLNQFLVKMSRSYREHLKEVLPEAYRPGPLVLDIDSTPHEQHGKKMEGLAWNYKDQWCLDSQVIFDELGFCYGVQLRSGNTKSGVEVGRFFWTPSWADSLKFPIVVKRTWVEAGSNQQSTLFDQLTEEGHWEYYAVLTNWNLYEHSYQEVMKFHQKRANSENFIREEKYGYDLKHFPCQKLIANHAFGLLALVAHNILRWAAIVQRPDRPHFLKNSDDVLFTCLGD
jgi:hypothetical protein